MPTPALPAADEWRVAMTVDLEETARAADEFVAAGVDGILTLGTLGECGALSWEEKQAFIDVLVSTVRGRIPVFGGTTCLGTRESIAQTRGLRDLGVDGTLVGPSMWNRPDAATAATFYRDLAEAVPDVAICVYANPFVFKFDFSSEFWARVSGIVQVACAKTASCATYDRDIEASGGRVRFMPLESEYLSGARQFPDLCTAFWSSGASCGPAPATTLRDVVNEAKRTGDWSAAEEIGAELSEANLPTIAYGDFDTFQTHNVALEKGRMNAAGWMNAGPNRPPYHVVPESIEQLGAEGGRRWALLQRKYSKPA